MPDRLRARILAAAAAALLALAGAGCGSDDEEEGTDRTSDTSAGEASGGPGGPTQTSEAAEGCEEVPGEEPGGQRCPAEPLPAEARPKLRVATNRGSFTITLDAELAPNATASLVALARADFYDDTRFHRIVPGFVVQGGDPTATGMGGPGYRTEDPPPADQRYTRGVVAMAKGGPEPPGSAGSQFFVVTGADVGLPPDYAVVGEVTDGLDVVERIGELGDPATEEPTERVVIEDVTVSGV